MSFHFSFSCFRILPMGMLLDIMESLLNQMHIFSGNVKAVVCLFIADFLIAVLDCNGKSCLGRPKPRLYCLSYAS